MRHWAVTALGLCLAALLFVGCVSSPQPASPSPVNTAPPSPSATPIPPTMTPYPFEGLAEWEVVVIGDSSLWGVGEPYATLIEQDRGVEVTLHDEWQGGLSARAILEALRGEDGGSAKREKWPELIRNAQVLVLFGNPVDSLGPEALAVAESCLSNLDPGEEAITPDSFAQYKADLSAIYDEVAKLREGRPMILRAVGIYNPVISVWREKGFEDVCRAFWDGQNDAVRQAAEQTGVPFVDTYAAFNGADHNQDPRERAFIRSDGEHPSEAGAQFYAALLGRSGYDVWVPK